MVVVIPLEFQILHGEYVLALIHYWHEQFKPVYYVASVLLKNVGNIEGSLFRYFIALMIRSFIEREIRDNSAKFHGDFALVELNWSEAGRKIVKKFLPELTERSAGSG
ncbi:hypothetical protein, partial [Ferroplasma sp. Type II]|uniref:hypothetical protein n=1 Tax=Ferroplasma sp. Type II TaxID=261388 RepID=UPI0025C3A437